MQHFHLMPDGNSWKLSCGTAYLVVDRFDTKEAAIDACAKFIGQRGGSLRIFADDGIFEEERVFPSDSD